MIECLQKFYVIVTAIVNIKTEERDEVSLDDVHKWRYKYNMKRNNYEDAVVSTSRTVYFTTKTFYLYNHQLIFLVIGAEDRHEYIKSKLTFHECAFIHQLLIINTFTIVHRTSDRMGRVLFNFISFRHV